jgi:hypothetical protein
VASYPETAARETTSRQSAEILPCRRDGRDLTGPPAGAGRGGAPAGMVNAGALRSAPPTW